MLPGFWAWWCSQICCSMPQVQRFSGCPWEWTGWPLPPFNHFLALLNFSCQPGAHTLAWFCPDRAEVCDMNIYNWHLVLEKTLWISGLERVTKQTLRQPESLKMHSLNIQPNPYQARKFGCLCTKEGNAKLGDCLQILQGILNQRRITQ